MWPMSYMVAEVVVGLPHVEVGRGAGEDVLPAMLLTEATTAVRGDLVAPQAAAGPVVATSGWSVVVQNLWIFASTAQRPCQPLGMITQSPGPKGCSVPSTSVRQPSPESTMNHSVMGLWVLEGQAPSVQAQKPHPEVPAMPLRSGRVKSSGVPRSAPARRPLGVIWSMAPYERGATVHQWAGPPAGGGVATTGAWVAAGARLAPLSPLP
mmetsp:Transcript_34908/g.110271  ORF Transcript_34908/g.110271 Transcript_34908/m.110271 type:complete len:209 (-) Transcript_34908:210-836(-)